MFSVAPKPKLIYSERRWICDVYLFISAPKSAFANAVTSKENGAEGLQQKVGCKFGRLYMICTSKRFTVSLAFSRAVLLHNDSSLQLNDYTKHYLRGII